MISYLQNIVGLQGFGFFATRCIAEAGCPGKPAAAGWLTARLR